jgi:hypothetical protein
MTGRLVLVATPIGNLGDLSPRAVDTLSQSSLILCEDTRHSGKLLSHAGISGVRLAVCNEHTENERSREVLSLLDAGETVTLITDAGTPGISDPGSRLVRAAIDSGHVVSAVPGPAAFVMALVISGFDTSRFVFEGFLPRSGRERSARLAAIAAGRCGEAPWTTQSPSWPQRRPGASTSSFSKVLLRAGRSATTRSGPRSIARSRVTPAKMQSRPSSASSRYRSGGSTNWH